MWGSGTRHILVTGLSQGILQVPISCRVLPTAGRPLLVEVLLIAYSSCSSPVRANSHLLRRLNVSEYQRQVKRRRGGAIGNSILSLLSYFRRPMQMVGALSHCDRARPAALRKQEGLQLPAACLPSLNSD